MNLFESVLQGVKPLNEGWVDFFRDGGKTKSLKLFSHLSHDNLSKSEWCYFTQCHITEGSRGCDLSLVRKKC